MYVVQKHMTHIPKRPPDLIAEGMKRLAAAVARAPRATLPGRGAGRAAAAQTA